MSNTRLVNFKERQRLLVVSEPGSGSQGVLVADWESAVIMQDRAGHSVCKPSTLCSLGLIVRHLPPLVILVCKM